ncbi:MAG TPA: chorismate synthase, partial [Actinomycetales bacterium]|nr:chorismate synthase [Actinomycetales bacterium]
FTTAARRGSAAHDEILIGGRETNRAGGIEGGMSNGLPVVVRAALKPISSIPRALRTIDSATGEEASAINQRSDTCAVAPAAVVAQAMVAIELATALLEKTGGDSVAEARRNLEAYLAAVDPNLTAASTAAASLGAPTPAAGSEATTAAGGLDAPTPPAGSGAPADSTADETHPAAEEDA